MNWKCMYSTYNTVLHLIYMCMYPMYIHTCTLHAMNDTHPCTHTMNRWVKRLGVAEGWNISWYSGPGEGGVGCTLAVNWLVEETSDGSGDLEDLWVKAVRLSSFSSSLSLSKTAFIMCRVLEGGRDVPFGLAGLLYWLLLSTLLVIEAVMRSSRSLKMLSGGIPYIRTHVHRYCVHMHILYMYKWFLLIHSTCICTYSIGIQYKNIYI